ncbi:hypothetical protein CUMW_141570, partial [Citrus unshiu]
NDTLTGDASSTDKATIGERLLKEPVSRVNLATGILEPVKNRGTNEQALVGVVKLLSEERTKS